MTLQTYLLASLSNTDAWNNHFLTLLSDRGIHIINANSRREEPHPPSLSRSFWADSNCPRSFSNLMPVFSSLHSRLWPGRQVCIPNQEPSATSQPGMRTQCMQMALRSLPAPQFHLQRCCGSHPGARSSSPQASTNLLSKWTGSASSCLPELGLCRCWTLPEGAALTHWAMVWQSLQTGGKKKKTQPKHFHWSPRRALGRHSRRGTLKCDVYFPRTAFPFSNMNSLPSNHQASQLPIQGSQSPGGKAHPSPDTNHWLICCARGNSVQPKNSHLILPSLFSLCCLNTPW